MYRPGGGASRLTWRLIHDLYQHLPPESASKALAWDELTPEQRAGLPRPAGDGQWSSAEMRLADIFDRLGWLVYATYHSQGGKPKKPDPMPRPGVKSKRRRPARASGPERAAHVQKATSYLDQLRARHQQITGGPSPP